MKKFVLALAISAFAAPAFADNIADRELVLLQEIKHESGNGGTPIASYRPADEFLAGLYSKEAEITTEIDGLKIRAVMCARNDVIPTKTDFEILATGIPFVLSQNFDSAKSDLMTYYFKDGEFRYQHKGPDMSKEALGDLKKRMAFFNKQDHTLGKAAETTEGDDAKSAKAEAPKSKLEPKADDKKVKKPTKQKPITLEKRKEYE